MRLLGSLLRLLGFLLVEWGGGSLERWPLESWNMALETQTKKVRSSDDAGRMKAPTEKAIQTSDASRMKAQARSPEYYMRQAE